MRVRSALFAAVISLGVPAVHAADADSYTHEVQQWREARLARLTAPYGWLSLVGLPWLQQGRNRVGSAADNDIVLPRAPAHLGTVDWLDDGSVRIEVAPGNEVTVDGERVRTATLLDDSHEQPTTVRFGTAEFYVIDRDGRKGLRVKDSEAPTRAGFQGIDHFPIDPSWRIEARWVPVPKGTTLEMGTVIGTTEKYPVPGKVEFRRDGQTFDILPVIEVPGDSQYFVVFADRTSGKETYGAARFVYIDPPQDGRVVIDFNKAYNPPCAFTPFATCPLAPPENRLDVRVTAGEKNYRGNHD